MPRLHLMTPLHCRFINNSNAKVNVYWLVSKTHRVFYGTLEPTQFLDVNTFISHSWVFEDVATGDHLLGNGQCIYCPLRLLQLPKATKAMHICLMIWRRFVIHIRSPLLPLRELSLNAIRDTGIPVNQVDELDLPLLEAAQLKTAITIRDCCRNHYPTCHDCIFSIYKAHVNHKCDIPKTLKD